jgi:hypothetical protein
MLIKRVEILEGENLTISLHDELIQPIIDSLTQDATQFLRATKLIYSSQVISFLLHLKAKYTNLQHYRSRENPRLARILPDQPERPNTNDIEKQGEKEIGPKDCRRSDIPPMFNIAEEAKRYGIN